MKLLLWIALGSGIGGVCRIAGVHWLHQWVDPIFPIGTLLANVAGSFLIGLLATWLSGVGGKQVSEYHRHFWITGFCGGFTTFSVFSLDALHLIQEGYWVSAVSYITLTFLLCLIAVGTAFHIHRTGDRLLG